MFWSALKQFVYPKLNNFVCAQLLQFFIVHIYFLKTLEWNTHSAGEWKPRRLPGARPRGELVGKSLVVQPWLVEEFMYLRVLFTAE